MGPKHQPASADPLPEPKKRRRVAFFKIDEGVEANDCFKIFLVSSKEEVGKLDSFCISPVDLNCFFEEDGKIYGYQDLKITVWVSIISFRSYADITFQSTSDGGKGITDLKSALQRMFAETLIENKEEFLETFSAENHFVRSMVSNGEIVQASNGHITDYKSQSGATSSDLEVVRMLISNEATGHLYSRLVPLVLLLVDGSNPIEVDDPGWVLYVLIQKKNDGQGDIQHRVLGFTAVYRFYHYPDTTRLRLSQILVLPPYQRKGYAQHLVEVVNSVAISEDVYDLTVEEPLDHFQRVRTCVDIKRLLAFDLIQDPLNTAVSQLKQGKLSKKTKVPRLLPPLSAVEDVRKTLKINKTQFLQCWEVLVYLGLDPADKGMEDFIAIISNRVKVDILGKDSGSNGKQVVEVPSDYNPEASFVMFRSQVEESSGNMVGETQANQQEQLQQLVDERINEIKLIAQKVKQA